MKKVFNLKSITRTLAVVMILGSVLVGCKSYDRQIDDLNADVVTLKSDVTKQIGDLKTQLEATINAEVTRINGEIAALKADLATKATKEEVTALAVRIQALENFKTNAEGQIAELQAGLALAATKEELLALKDEVNAKILELSQTLTALEAKVETLDGNLTELKGKVDQNTADIAALKADVNTRIALLEGILDVKDGKSVVIEGIKTQLADQLNLINANTDKINDLLTRMKAAEDKIKKNTEDIATLRAEVNILNKNMKEIAKAMSLNFSALSNRLTGLTFVAEYYVNSIPAMDFSPLMSACKTITPSVQIAYHLSPSFITEEDIETDNMSFVLIKDTKNVFKLNGAFGAPSAEQSEVEAIYDSIANGKIYVSVAIAELDKVFGNMGTKILGVTIEETFPSVVLQIPLSEKAVTENELVFDANGGMTVVNGKEYPADRVVTASHYVRLDYNKLVAQKDVQLGLNDADQTFPLLVHTAAEAKELSVEGIDGATETSPTVIWLPYKGTINLADTVAAILVEKEELFDVEKYGLKFKFDLLDEKGQTIEYVRNTVNQQTLVNLSNAALGTVSAKDVPMTTIATSKGRTPIIRVTMYNDQDPTCPVLIGFIKLAFKEQPDINLAFEFEKSAAICDTTDLALTSAWTVTNIYNKVGMTSTVFHTNYNPFTQEGDGIVTEIADGDNLVLNWAISPQEVWTKLNANPTLNEVSFKTVVTYKALDQFVNPDFVVTLTKTFTRPTDEAKQNILVAELIAKYWYDKEGKNNGKVFEEVKHNVNVPTVDENTTTNTLFLSDISSAFVQDADKSLKGYDNYEYYFLPTQPLHVDGTNGGTRLTVSEDGQELLSGTEVVATINPFAANVGDVLELNRESETGKRLLNYGPEFFRATLGVRYQFCPELVDADNNPIPSTMAVTVAGNPSFDVVFVRPINADGVSGENFVDAVKFGEKGSYMTVAELVNLKDWRGEEFAEMDNLYGYYGVEMITVDVANIKTNLNGPIVPLSDFPSLRVLVEPTVPGVTEPAEFGYLTYRNNGVVIGNDFELYVPVTVTYYWGTIQSTIVTVPVQKTIGPSGVKRK